MPYCEMDGTPFEGKLHAIAGAIENSVTHILHQPVIAWKKADLSPVTNIDLQIQEAIVAIIRRRYGNDEIIGEEANTNSNDNASAYVWVIDPIDGTDNFINGKKEYGISVGLMKDGLFVEALLLFPALAEKYYAARDRGVWRNNNHFYYKEPMDNPTEKEVILCSKTYPRLRSLFLQQGYKVGFYYCATYSMLRLLHGDSLMYHTVNTKLYDVGPMSLLLTESGIDIHDKDLLTLKFSHKDLNIPFFLAMTKKAPSGDILQILNTGR